MFLPGVALLLSREQFKILTYPAPRAARLNDVIYETCSATIKQVHGCDSRCGTSSSCLEWSAQCVFILMLQLNQLYKETWSLNHWLLTTSLPAGAFPLCRIATAPWISKHTYTYTHELHKHVYTNTNLCTHYCNFSWRPSIVDVTTEMLRTHHIICSTISLWRV